MTYEEMLKVRPGNVVSLDGRQDFHIISVFMSDDLHWRVVADRDWADYMKHFKLSGPGHGYRTQAEVDGTPMPDIRLWEFTFNGRYEDVKRSERHMKMLTLVEKKDLAK